MYPQFFHPTWIISLRWVVLETLVCVLFLGDKSSGFFFVRRFHSSVSLFAFRNFPVTKQYLFVIVHFRWFEEHERRHVCIICITFSTRGVDWKFSKFEFEQRFGIKTFNYIHNFVIFVDSSNQWKWDIILFGITENIPQLLWNSFSTTA